jgi:hypothetical protein
MPIKKLPNRVSLRTSQTLSIVSANKKSHFDSESKLFDALQSALITVNVNYTVYLSTYPCVAAHIDFGNIEQLIQNQDRIESVIQGVFEAHLKNT